MSIRAAVYAKGRLFDEAGAKVVGGTVEMTIKNDGVSYDLIVSPAGSPFITSHKTGNLWLISWNDLIQLAVEAGINKPADKKASIFGRIFGG